MANVQVAPKKAGKVTNELQLVAGENELIKAVRKHGCFCTSEDNIVVTNQRVQFLWRKWFCGINLGKVEEAFDLDDLHFVSLSQSNPCCCCCCCGGGMTLSLNFSRHQASIFDWTGGKISKATSGTRRTIKLHNSEAQETYNQLQNMLQQRAALKARK